MNIWISPTILSTVSSGWTSSAYLHVYFWVSVGLFGCVSAEDSQSPVSNGGLNCGRLRLVQAFLNCEHWQPDSCPLNPLNNKFTWSSAPSVHLYIPLNSCGSYSWINMSHRRDILYIYNKAMLLEKPCLYKSQKKKHSECFGSRYNGYHQVTS